MVLRTEPPSLHLAKASPFDAIHRAADQAAGTLAAQIEVALNELARQLPNLEQLLAAGRLDQIMDAVSVMRLPARVTDTIRYTLLDVALQVAQPASVALGMSFTLVNPYAVRWAEQNVGTLITSVTAETKQAIAQMVAQGIRDGHAPRVLATEIRSMVGLLPRHAASIQRFISSFDDPAFGARQAQRRADRLLRWRAENIARTETIRAANMGQQAAWTAATDAGLLPRTARKVWVATDDARTCPICAELDGTVVGLEGEFALNVDGNGRAVHISERQPPAHPSCRCTTVLELG